MVCKRTLYFLATIRSNVHISPGRFFAAAEVKTMLAHVLLNYDIKMANDAGRPTNISIGSEMMPDPSAEVLFRKRCTENRKICGTTVLI